MPHKLLLIAAVAASLAACAPAASRPALTASRAAPSTGCSALPRAREHSGGAWLVEGFGGRGETQLIVSERRPTLRCALPTGAATRATLAALR